MSMVVTQLRRLGVAVASVAVLVAASACAVDVPDPAHERGPIGSEVSLRRANELAAYEIRVPDYWPGDLGMERILASDWLPRAEMQIALMYPDEAQVLFIPRSNAPRYHEQIDIMGIGSVTTFRGKPALVLGPGEHSIEGGNSVYHLGLLRWWAQPGLEVVIHADLPVSELLKIAASM